MQNLNYKSSNLVWLAIMILALLCGGTFRVLGPISIRNVVSVLLILFLLLNVSSIPQNIKPLKSYFVFLLVYIFCSIINGDMTKTDFLYNILSRHIPCVLMFLAVPLLMRQEKMPMIFCWSWA